MVLEKRKPLLTYLGSVLFLFFVAVTYNSLDPTLFLFGVCLSFIGFGTWLFSKFRSKTALRYPRILFPIVIYLSLRLITTSLAPFTIPSLESVLKEMLILVGFVFVFDTLHRPWKPTTWENALINFALIFSIIELLLAFFWHRTWWQITDSPLSLPPVGYRSLGVFLGHANVMAGFLNLIVPIVLVRLFQELEWKRRILWISGLLLFAVAFYFTSSRTGLLAGILGVGTTIALFFGPRIVSKFLVNKRISLRQVMPTRYLIIAIPLLILGLAFIYFFFVQSQTMISHAPTLISARSSIWGPAFDIIQESPWLGNGPGSFSPFFAQVTKIPPGFATSHAHNIFLQTAAETGIVGTLLVLAIIIIVIMAFFRSWQNATPSAKLRLSAYAGAGVATLSHHMLDYLFESPIYTLSFLIIVALALEKSQSSEIRLLEKPLHIFISAVLLVAILTGLLYTTGGAFNYSSGVNAGREREWEKAEEQICSGFEERPSIPLYGIQCSLAKAQVYSQTNEAQSLQSTLELQREMLEKDSWPVHWANLAVYEWLIGEFATAIEHMRLALDLAPNNATFAINLARMEEQHGELEGAMNAYLSALTIDPWMQFSHIYTDSSIAHQALGLYQLNPTNDHLRTLSLLGWELISSNQLAEAESTLMQAIEAYPTDARAYAGLALVELHFNRLDEALYNVKVAVFLATDSPHILHTAGNIAQQQGLEEDARQYFQRAFDLVENRSYSSSYYYRTYNRFFLDSDLTLQMPRGDLTTAMLESFSFLAQYHEKNGASDQATIIQKRLEIELGAYQIEANAGHAP